jgi:CheY-like chemotaxis protein
MQKAAASPLTASPATTPGAEVVLLSVDDDPSVAPLLQKMLSPHGYRVVAASAPEAAVAEARQMRPAVILLDVLMPRRDGHDVLRELKADPETRGIPVLVISVVDATEVPEMADGHINKPVQTAPLLQLLEQHGAASSVQDPWQPS